MGEETGEKTCLYLNHLIHKVVPITSHSTGHIQLHRSHVTARGTGRSSSTVGHEKKCDLVNTLNSVKKPLGGGGPKATAAYVSELKPKPVKASRL